MTELIHTFSFVKEQDRNRSAPMLFLCETARGLEQYWLKCARQTSEFDCLVYELVCQRLARLVGLLVPDVALAVVTADSFVPGDLVQNWNLQPGDVAFASKHLSVAHDMVDKLTRIANETAFNQYAEPLDFIRIALFDMHTDNRDRTEENFNLLLTKTRPQQLCVIDHFDCFGSVGLLGRFTANLPFNLRETILRADLCQQAIRWLDATAIQDMLAQYQYLCSPAVLNALVDEVIADVPTTWTLSLDLADRLKGALTNKDRLLEITTQISDFITQCKRLAA